MTRITRLNEILEVLEAAGGKLKIEVLERLIVRKTNVSIPTAKRYINELEDMGKIKFVFPDWILIDAQPLNELSEVGETVE